MDALKELCSHYQKVKCKIAEYEEKPSLDNRQTSSYLQWLSLAGVLCERIFDLEHRDRFHGYDAKNVEFLKADLFSGDWVDKPPIKKRHGDTKDFRR